MKSSFDKKNKPRDTKGMPKQAPAAVVSPIATRIDQVKQLLGIMLQWSAPADKVLSAWFKEHARVGVRDRGEIAEAAYYVLRHLRRLRYLAESGVGPASKRLAILGLHATMKSPQLLNSVLDESENEWLNRVLTLDVDRLPLDIKHSIPEWLLTQLSSENDLEPMLAALNQAAPLDVRINPIKTDRDTVIESLRQWMQIVELEATPYSPYGIRIHGRPPLAQWEPFNLGHIEVQDEGSQLLSLLVGPKRSEFIIDFCAGAGGKTLLLGAMMRNTGRLYALDVSEKRLSRLKPRLARSGLSNVMPIVIDSERDARIKRFVKKAHRVLVDAPCSGTGTLRRNPDLKWRQSPQSLLELTALQQSILQSASRCVAPGGRLVYATCSLLKQENQDQVELFLKNNPDFELLSASEVLAGKCGDFVGEAAMSGPYLQLRPDRHNTDGFFAAVLERKRESP